MKKEKKEKERREQPKQKTDSPMITSAKNYIKEKKTERLNPRTNDQSKSYTDKNHTKKRTHTHLQKEKKEKNINIIAPKVHRLNFGMICCLFRYSRDAGYIKLTVEI